MNDQPSSKQLYHRPALSNAYMIAAPICGSCLPSFAASRQVQGAAVDTWRSSTLSCRHAEPVTSGYRCSLEAQQAEVTSITCQCIAKNFHNRSGLQQLCHVLMSPSPCGVVLESGLPASLHRLAGCRSGVLVMLGCFAQIGTS